ncbi:MAG TPA: T9SS type A sorting domain-containing protein [Bacteroidia bacterium]|nr:T9SS type A sorting domain-containing protein [Bacteroidia bacterium]
MRRNLLSFACAIAGMTAYAQTTVTFNYTGALQTFTVPPCVTTIHIEARGAQGGEVTVQAPLPQGGLGATMTGDFAVNPGDVLSIIVGGRGSSDPSSSGGGGGSGVNLNSTPLIVAGGGAGVDFQDPFYPGQDAVTTNDGVVGNGGDPGAAGTGGGNGGDHAYTPTNISRGGNGWLAGNNGSTGVDGTSSNTTWTTGTWGLGGGGGSVGYGWCNCGGGGGGYSGGGSADINNTGGGGGSYNVGTNQVNTGGNNTGDGMVIITYTISGSAPTSPTMIAGTANACASSGTLTYSIPPVAGATGYTWTVGSPSTLLSGQGTTNITVQPGTGTSVISVTADNSCGSSAPTSFTLTITAPPVVALGSNVTQCGGTITLDAQNPGATYLWSDASTNQTLVVSASGTYYVTVTDVSGCSGTDTMVATINTVPTVALGSDITQCGGTVTLDAQNAGSIYLWNEGTTTQTLVASSSGTYSVVVTDANGCSSSDEIAVTINTIPTVTGSAPSGTVCVADGASPLTGTPSGGTWAGPGVMGSMFDPGMAGLGTHQLIYDYTDANGCSASDTISIFVDVCTGIETPVSNGMFDVYPNPNSGTFSVQFVAPATNVVITITDLAGRTVYTSNTTDVAAGTMIPVELTGVSNGVYMMEVRSGENTATQKVMISK